MRTSPSVINKLILARHLFWIAFDNLKSHREVALFAAINLLQDSVEAFLLAASEHLNAGIEARTGFEQYIPKIDERLAPEKLPFRSKLFALNKARVLSKHNGVRPNREELESFAVACREFFDETCRIIFGLEFWSVSLIDLLEDGEIKSLLQSAEKAYVERDWLNCMIECRKVLFLEIERHYDIAEFRNADESRGFFGPFSEAPFYAKNREYIEQRVSTPFDYIVFDYDRLPSKLLSEAVDPQVFWNVWSLTPEVYRFRESGKFVGDWHVKREPAKEKGADDENAGYVLEQMIDIALHLAQRRRLSRHSRIGTRFYVDLKQEGVNVYQKADKRSAVTRVTPPGLKRFDVSYGTVGLDGSSYFWYVFSVIEGEGGRASEFVFGFIDDDDVAVEVEETS